MEGDNQKQEDFVQEPTECPSETELAGRADVCAGCPGQAFCQSQGGPDPDQEMIDLRMNAIKHKIMILSGKGGVGKSTVAVNLSLALANEDAKVGVVDLDICGPSMPKLLKTENQQVVNSQWGWKPLVSEHYDIKVMSVGSLLPSDSSAVTFRGPRKTGLIKRFFKDTLWGRLDYLICDTPPGTSDEHLTVVKILKNTKPDGAIIVTTPQEVSVATIAKEINFCKKMGIRILGLIENMSGFVCPCCNEETDIFLSGGGEKLCERFGIKFLGKIPISMTIANSGEDGADITSQTIPNTAIDLPFKMLAKNIKNVVENL